ncbi:TetR family transcriptional regulator [Hydrogenophaga taeniospiralis CCUG 15921]|uniref:TetR family transcriptional regulator n=1 Tax=Hydrogenophaga taeniospiralis CCUG 15921 TaxID=1281780 RepID=A0A9X4NST2_9BURK|nr:TetR/AcrR family transcriptional regulator [Hydrogenophaga taeniospiralis]MDG5976717.1 TetR family transcriptional regulator [Hydrogenophaga taeniospiralis CCUG 15921]
MSPTTPTKRQRSDAARPLQKGQQTKAAIVDAALGLATQIGLEGLSIGALAEVMQMSKSGVFAHFGSREELQISVVREYHARFEEEVFYPAMSAPRGLPRLRMLFDNWMKRTSVEIDSGCIYISGAVQFEDRPGPVRDALASSVNTWLSAVRRSVEIAVEEGHLRADTDAAQMGFEIHALILALHYEARFLRSPDSLRRALQAFEGIVHRFSSATTPGLPPTPQPAPRARARKPASTAARS